MSLLTGDVTADPLAGRGRHAAGAGTRSRIHERLAAWESDPAPWRVADGGGRRVPRHLVIRTAVNPSTALRHRPRRTSWSGAACARPCWRRARAARRWPWRCAAAGRRGDLRLHVRIDERSAAFLALGLAKASRRPVAVVCTSGTAAAQFHPAVIEADESGVPLIVLTADRPPELRGTGANQTIDQVKLYGGAVRWFCETGVPEARPGMARLLAVAGLPGLGGRVGRAGGFPGPVHLNVPLRDPLVPDRRPGGDAAGRSRWTAGPGGAPWTSFGEPPRRTSRCPGWSGRSGGWWSAGTATTTPGRCWSWPRRPAGRCWPSRRPAPGRAERAVGLQLPARRARVRRRAPARRHRLGRAARPVPRPAGVPARTPGRRRPARGRGPGTGPLGRPGPHRHLRRRRGAAGRRGPAAAAQRGWLASWRAADAAAAAAAADAILDAGDGLSASRGWPGTWPRPLPDGRAAVGRVQPADPGPGPAHGAARRGPGAGQPRDQRHRRAWSRRRSGPRWRTRRPAAARPSRLLGDLAFLHDAPGLMLGPGEPRPDLCLVVVNNDGGGIFSVLEQAAFAGPFERLFGTPHGADSAAWRRGRAAVHPPERPADLAGALSGTGCAWSRCAPSGPPARPAGQAPRGRHRGRGWRPGSGGRRPGPSASPPARPASARNLTWVSASSASGSESATMPQPGEQPGPAAVQLRAPQRDAPLAVARASTQPTGPAYRPRSMPSSSRISSMAAPAGVAAHRGGGVQRRRRSASTRMRAAARARPASRPVIQVAQVLHVGQPQQRGPGVDVEPVAERRQRGAHLRDRVLVLLDVLGRGEQGRAERLVLGLAAAARRGPASTSELTPCRRRISRHQPEPSNGSKNELLRPGRR